MLEPAPPQGAVHRLQGHLPLRRGDLQPAQPGQGLGPLHRLRPVRIGLPHPVHCAFHRAGPARPGPHRLGQRHHLDRLRTEQPPQRPGADLRGRHDLGVPGLPGPVQKTGAGPDPLRGLRKRPLRQAAAGQPHPAGGVPGGAAVQRPDHPGLPARRGPLPGPGTVPPGDVLPPERQFPEGRQAAAAPAAGAPGRRGQPDPALPLRPQRAAETAENRHRDPLPLWGVPAGLQQQVLRLRPLREELQGRGHPAGRPGGRPDPGGHHPLEVQRVRHVRVHLQPQGH